MINKKELLKEFSLLEDYLQSRPLTPISVELLLQQMLLFYETSQMASIIERKMKEESENAKSNN
ncbi:MAG: hypothetical protein GTO02_13510 [Candidatus Dadabacteria bacterium]|nr:hypothetical protein [Candidatus Dadabacteria bacterium]